MVVVEDDQSIREMLRYYFNSVGFDVMTYESGEEYFEAVRERTPSIFIWISCCRTWTVLKY
jgi:two-component system alkaline phosphatase synthesis response regulator PhoP